MKVESPQIKDGLTPRWREALLRAGFAANGDDRWHRDQVSVRRDENWLQLETVSHPAPTDLSCDMGRPGLWKCIGEASSSRRVFEFPASAVSPDNEVDGCEESMSATPDAFLAWAHATEQAGLVPGWHPPGRALIESWLPPASLTVRAGPLVRQGDLIVTPERWAVRFPILSAVPLDLSAARRAWLRAVLSDAQTLWRMVRLGFAGDAENLAVACEVNFTGRHRARIYFWPALRARAMPSRPSPKRSRCWPMQRSHRNYWRFTRTKTNKKGKTKMTTTETMPGPTRSTRWTNGFHFEAVDVTNTHSILLDERTMPPGTPAGAAAQAVAAQMELPQNVAWALRDETTGNYLDEQRAIGDQINEVDEPRLTVAPKTHLGGG